ncbi:extracellular solute-binding protein [Propionibacteriaceae bacterium Y2011]
MRPITRRTALGLSAAAAASPLLAACSGNGSGNETQKKIDSPDPNINLTGMPIVKEKTTIQFMSSRYPGTAEDWNTVLSMKTMEELSNVHINFGTIPQAGIVEKRNLALASGDYPEVFFRTNMAAPEIAKYADQGTFVPLNDLIDNYMPNLTAILDANPEIRNGLEFPDGNIYSLPTLFEPTFQTRQLQQKLWVRKDWLDAFGMSVPTTLDEFEAYLTAVKTRDPNGNGKAEEIPLSDGSRIQSVYRSLWGTFDIGNKGFTNANVDLDPATNKVRFYPVSDGYRDEMAYLNRLYEGGLIQQDIFSITRAQFNATGKEGLYGSVVSQTPTGDFGAEIGDNYVAVPPLKKSAGDPVPSWNSAASPLAIVGAFTMTDKNTHPIVTARWVDYFYGDDGARLFFMGVEEKSYEKKGSAFEFVSEITDNPQGLTVDEALRPYVIYMGGGYPGIIKAAYHKGMESTEQAHEGTAVVAPHAIKDVWPDFTFSSEESAELANVTTDINKYVEESLAGFITGKIPMSDWDAYVKRFDSMGLADYLKIQNDAYERYIS